ncbi:MAG: serine/threonine-protein kinase, partial [Chloroflexota bacterium]
EIYTAESGGLLLAIKVVDVKTAPELLMRFQREITTLERAKHPNIVQVFDSGVDDDYAYMVMEYIDGIDLKSHIVENSPLPLEEIVVILRDIAAAVDYIHSLDIIHRDLKPGNIMLFWDSRNQVHATLLDFGVATSKALTVITLEGTVGTIEYMSPEQILDAPLVQPTSDVYAVGVMAYNMLTGELPYDGNMAAIMFGHLHNPVPDPRAINIDIDDDVAEAVMKAMAKEPEQRYPNMTAFVNVLAATLPASRAKAS